MKLIMIPLVLAFAVPAMATSIQRDSACMIKQKNAASVYLAQAEAQPVQNVNVVSFKYGMWTEMPGENSGSDDVTVTVETSSGTRIQSYSVAAKQIGSSADCNIFDVTEIKQ